MGNLFFSNSHFFVEMRPISRVYCRLVQIMRWTGVRRSKELTEGVVRQTLYRQSETRVGEAAIACLLGGALVASAYLMTLATQSADVRWLGWVTLVPLFLAIRILKPARAFCAGVLWGLSYCFFSGLAQRSGAGVDFGTVALLALVPGLYAGLGASLTRQIGFSPLLLGLGWIGVEVALRPLSLHNGLLASTQGNGLFVRTLGHLAGYVMLAFLVAYVNASLLDVLTVVCSPVGSSKQLSLSGGPAIKRLFQLDIGNILTHRIRPSGPRAPPSILIA